VRDLLAPAVVSHCLLLLFPNTALPLLNMDYVPDDWRTVKAMADENTKRLPIIIQERNLANSSTT
jgi:hypothetical protein